MGDKEIDQIVRELQRQNFTVTRSGKGRWIVRAPGGHRAATLPGTPGDRRGLLNALAHLRRAGFIWPPHGAR